MINSYRIAIVIVTLIIAGCVGGNKNNYAGLVMRFYVATDGNDVWSGKILQPNAERTDGPFATVARARDAIRDIKAHGQLTKPVNVYIRRGVYFLSEPLVFTAEDSGTSGCPITYAAYGKEFPVVISGGKRITGWGQDETGVWVTNVPEVKDGKWYFRQLFINGERRSRIRMPKTGFFRVDGEIAMEQPARFKFNSGDIKKLWAEPGDAEIVALQAWAEFRMPITAIDEASQTVTLSGKCAPSNRENNARYWVENGSSELQAPGEWHLNRSTGVLTYLSLPGEQMGKFDVIAPNLSKLVLLKGDATTGNFVSNINFYGITFSHTDWQLPATGYTDMQAAYDIPAAIEANDAVSVTIHSCAFTHLGNYAIAFGKGCWNNTIIGNEITDVGAGGIKIGEPQIRQAHQRSPGASTAEGQTESELTGYNIISHNHIYDIGIVYPAAVGIWVGQSNDNIISHNHIHDTYYSGISVGWTWGYGPTNAKENVISFNHIHDIGRQMLSDMGAIYALGVQPGTTINNNLIHDITPFSYGGWGIYLDEGSSQIAVENNIVYRTKTGGFHQHYGRENMVRNNIFALAKEGQIIRSREEPHLSFTFEHNIVYWKEGDLLGGNWNNGQYRMDNNIYYNAAGQPVNFANRSLEEWQKQGQDIHSIIADPMFEDPAKGDFRLKLQSPAFGLGFKNIDLPK